LYASLLHEIAHRIVPDITLGDNARRLLGISYERKAGIGSDSHSLTVTLLKLT